PPERSQPSSSSQEAASAAPKAARGRNGARGGTALKAREVPVAGAGGGGAPAAGPGAVPPDRDTSPNWDDPGSAFGRGREAFRVPARHVAVATDPAILPEEPRGSSGLFELVSPVARRALELGLAAREPSFHVFVAAEPEVMIEDDIVRHAARFANRDPRRRG